jgi:hypothetical protein
MKAEQQLFDREDGSDMFLQNVDGFSADYTALYPRRNNSSYPSL